MKGNEKKLAQKAIEAFDSLESFRAHQTITAGNIYIKALVEFQKPRNLFVQYQDYQNPMEEFQVLLTGGPEYLGEELCNKTIKFNGQRTWIHDQSSGLAEEKNGKRFYTPFTRISVLGQLGFLPGLIQDYLLKDDGQGTIEGRQVQRLSLKPKQRRRSYFLKTEIFQMREAQLALDEETGLPLKIVYTPSEEATLTDIPAPTGQIVVEYSDYVLNEVSNERFKFDSSKADKVFKEETVSTEELREDLPVSLNIGPLQDEDFELISENVPVMVDQDRNKMYCSISFMKDQPRSQEGMPPTVQVWAGNYLSKELSRHRSFTAEHGEDIELGTVNGKLVNRAEVVSEELGQDLGQSFLELGWETKGKFFYVMSQGLSADKLQQICMEIAG